MRTAIILVLSILVLTIGGVLLWRYLDTFESTDDAQVDGPMAIVGARVAGTVSAVYVYENSQVKQGQVVAELDTRDFVVAVKQAEAALAESVAQLRGAKPGVPITATSTSTAITTSGAEVLRAEAEVAVAQRDLEASTANLAQAEATNANNQAEVTRYQKLVAKEEVSREDFEARQTVAKASAAAVNSARATVAAAQKTIEQRNAVLDETRSRAEQARKNAPQQVAMQAAGVDSREAAVQAAEAALEQAKLNLEYTKLVSPVTGQVGRKAVEVGMQLQPGQQLLAVVPVEDIWITANFKETQVKRMKLNQRATIRVDAFDQDYEGYVESISPATGARFSILPPENTSGNYVKVVQRVPVRLRLKPGQDPEHRLRPGMSVTPKVWLQ
jgi:membrane fusion protein (multidrug efflux system)